MLIHSWSHHLKLYVHTTENINSKEVSIYFLFQVLPCFSVFFRWFYRPKKTKDCIIFVNIFFKSVLFFSPSRPGPVLDFGSLIISHSFLMDFPLLLSLRGCTSWFFNADMTIEVQFDSNVFPSSLVTQNAAIECIFLRMKVLFLFFSCLFLFFFCLHRRFCRPLGKPLAADRPLFLLFIIRKERTVTAAVLNQHANR